MSHEPRATDTSVLTFFPDKHYEDFDRETLAPIYDTIAQYSLMDFHERYFMNGIIRTLRPKIVLEVGVFNGGGSALILNAISDIDGAMLYSMDYAERSYADTSKPTGFLVEEKFPQFLDKWQMFRGGDCSRHIEAVGGDIDLLVLDTVHMYPWETLNFLCALPFMKIGSYVILHDITLEYLNMRQRNHLACRYLFSHVVSDEKVSPRPDYIGLPSNIGAFKVSEVTMKYVSNLFENLVIPWETEIKPEDLEDISAIIRKYYSPEQYKFFCEALDYQKQLKIYSGEKAQELTALKSTFYQALKNFVKSWQPKLFFRLKHFLKG